MNLTEYIIVIGIGILTGIGLMRIVDLIYEHIRDDTDRNKRNTKFRIIRETYHSKGNTEIKYRVQMKIGKGFFTFDSCETYTEAEQSYNKAIEEDKSNWIQTKVMKP